VKVHSAHVCEYARPWPKAVKGRDGVRRGHIITLFDAQGRCGQGEIAPLPPFTPGNNESTGLNLAEITSSGAALYLAEFASLTEVDAWVRSSSPFPTVRHGLEQALLGLLAHERGVSPEALFPMLAVEQVVSHRLVSTPEDAAEAVADGARTLKIKTSGLADGQLLDRVSSIRTTVGPGVQLRIDANQAWSFDQAVTTIQALKPFVLEFVEEPLMDATPRDLASLQAATGVAIACDESIRSLQDLNTFLEEGDLSVLVLKPMFIGGCLPSLEMADRAIEAGVKLVITSSLDGDLAHAHASLCARLTPSHGLLACGLAPSSSTLCQPPLGNDYSIPHPLKSASTARPDHIAWSLDDRQETFSSLARQVASRAGELAGAGIRQGQRVVLPIETKEESILDFWALTWLGAVPVLVDAKTQEQGLTESMRELGAIPMPSDKPHSHPSVVGVAWRLGDERLILFTSGSTGKPRPVILTTRQLIFSALGQAARLGHHLDDRWACALPLHHVGGLSILLRTAWLHTTAVLYPKWQAGRISKDIDEGNVSMLSLVPTMLLELLDAREERGFPGSLRVLLLGGARTPDSLLERCRVLGAPLSLTWGMTEAGSQIASNIPGDYEPSLAPLLTADIQSKQSHLTVTSPLVNGTFRTSDQGAIGPNGRVTITGRSDDVIISGGENISLLEITLALRAHSGVLDALVVGVNDPRWGERPWALIVPSTEEPRLTESMLRTHLANRLAAYKTPDRFTFVEGIPTNAMGKIAMASIDALFSPQAESSEPDLPGSLTGIPL
jgi:O-succinylbenzoic acid--CoA ligase